MWLSVRREFGLWSPSVSCPRRAGVIVDVMTDFLIGYVVAAGAGLADDPGLKAPRQSTGGVLCFREINAAPGDDERTRIGERYGIRVVPG